MNFILEGSGANIHAAAWKLMESREVGILYSKTENAGIKTLCKIIDDNFQMPDNTIELDVGNACTIEGKYMEIPCFLSNGKLYPICAVCAENDHAYTAPWDIDVNEMFDKIKSEICTKLKEYGIFTVCVNDSMEIIAEHYGFGEFGAVTVLPVLRGDMVKMLMQCKNGEKPEFKVINCSSVIRKHSKTGQKVIGLSKIPGSAGVFINSCEYKDCMITAGEIPLYIVCRGDTKEKSANALDMAEKYITFED